MNELLQAEIPVLFLTVMSLVVKPLGQSQGLLTSSVTKATSVLCTVGHWDHGCSYHVANVDGLHTASLFLAASRHLSYIPFPQQSGWVKSQQLLQAVQLYVCTELTPVGKGLGELLLHPARLCPWEGILAELSVWVMG